MKRVFSATEYKRALMPLSPEERQRIVSAAAEAARAEAEERNASCVILLCCGGFMEEIAALTAKGLEGMGLIAKIACLGRDDLPALARAIACDFLLFADGTAPKARWVVLPGHKPGHPGGRGPGHRRGFGCGCAGGDDHSSLGIPEGPVLSGRS